MLALAVEGQDLCTKHGCWDRSDLCTKHGCLRPVWSLGGFHWHHWRRFKSVFFRIEAEFVFLWIFFSVMQVFKGSKLNKKKKIQCALLSDPKICQSKCTVNCKMCKIGHSDKLCQIVWGPQIQLFSLKWCLLTWRRASEDFQRLHLKHSARFQKSKKSSISLHPSVLYCTVLVHRLYNRVCEGFLPGLYGFSFYCVYRTVL